MKGWQVIAGLSLWLCATGCAHDGVLRKLISSDQSPVERSSASPDGVPVEAQRPHQPSIQPRPPLAARSPVQFGKPIDTAAEVPLNPGPEKATVPRDLPGPKRSQRDSPQRIQTVAFRGQDLLPTPRNVQPDKAISLTLDDVEVRKAFELLGKEGALNILVSPAIAGKVSISLKGVTFDQAFDALLKVSHSVAKREKGIIYIHTPEELARIGDEKLSIRLYRLNYIKSVDLEKMIKPFLSTKGKLTTSPSSAVGIQSLTQTSGASTPPGGNGGAMGGGGVPSVGSGSGTGSTPGTGGSTGSATGGDSLASGEVVIIQDREEILKTIEPLILQLDVQPSQVLIEAVILLVRLDKGKEFGINFAVVNSAGKVLSVVGNGALLNTAVGFSPASLVDGAGLVKGNVATGFAADKYAGSFGFTSNNVQGFIRAVETLGKTEILAAPRLLVLNKQLAELQLGDRLGYTTFSQSQVSTIQQVQFLNVGTQLRVRPFISSDGMVRMEVHPERSSGSVINNIPQTNTAEVTTNVMVPDGATIVIGGLIENIREKHQNGIPFLSNLPGVGALFRERTQTDTKTELIVLLTPRIWNPNQVDACPPPTASHPSLSPPAQPLSLPKGR